MDNESKPTSTETHPLRPEAKLTLEENSSGSFNGNYSVEPGRDVALFVEDKGTSVTQIPSVDMYSEGPLSVHDDTNRENEIGVPSWYLKHPTNSIIHSVEFNSEPSKSPSQYPLSEIESERKKPPVLGHDHKYALTGSGIPEKYFLASPKEDAATAEWHQQAAYYSDEYTGSDRESSSRKKLDRTLPESDSYLRDISNIPSNRTLIGHKNAASAIDSSSSQRICGPFASSTPTSPYRIPVTTMPQFYWTITQQRREPMGSESTDSPGYSNTPLANNSPSIATSEPSESAGYEQLPGTVVDITISPATSVTVYSDNDTVSADFRLIRPPLVGQSSDGAITGMLQNADRQATLPNEHETEISASFTSSNNDSFCEESDFNCREEAAFTESSNKQIPNTSTLPKISQDVESSAKKLISHNENKNVNRTSTNQNTFHTSSSLKSASGEQDPVLATDQCLNHSHYNPAESGPSSLEYQQRGSSTTQPKESEKSYMQTRYYLIPSAVQQQTLATNESNKYTKRAASLDSNEADVESGKSGYQSDNRAISPTSVSSVSSNRKLEWDNGADIGYSAVINAANNKFMNTFRSEPEGIPTRCRDNATATTGTATVQQSSKHFSSRLYSSQEHSKSAISNSDESSLQVIGEKVILANVKPNILGERKQVSSEELNHHTSKLHNSDSQPQLSVRSIGSRSSADSLSSNSTVKLVNKVGATDNAEIRSSLSSPLSEPVGTTFGKLVHFDKALLKSKSDSSTLDVSSSVTTCMPESRPASTSNINGSVYYDRYNNYDSQDISQHLSGMEIRSFSPDVSQSSIEDEDVCYLSDQEVQLTLLKTNAQLEYDNSLYNAPASVFVQGINVPNNGVLLAKSNVSKSLSNLYDSTNEIGPASMLLPDDVLPPEIRDITSLRMYLEERYQNEISGLPSDASPNENIIILDAAYEEFEKDGLLTDGAKIRWYPVTGSELPQDIRDASTQTAVSYLTQHGIEPNAIGISCSDNRTRNTIQVTSVGISTKETPSVPNLLSKQIHSTDVPKSVQTKQHNSDTVEKLTSVASDKDNKAFISRKELINAGDSLQIHSTQIPIFHSHAYKDIVIPNTKLYSKSTHSTDLPIVQTDTTGKKCITSNIRSSLSKPAIPNGDLIPKCVTATSYSDSETCETKGIQTSRAHSFPLQLPPLSNSLMEKLVKNHDPLTVPPINNPNNNLGTNSMVILGTRLTSSVENGCEYVASNGFPKLDAKPLPRFVPSVQTNVSTEQPTIHYKNDSLNASRSTYRKTASTKLAACTATVPSIIPVRNFVGDQGVTNMTGRLYDRLQTDSHTERNIPSQREVLTSNGGVFVRAVGSNHNGNHPTQNDLSHYFGYRRRLPHSEIISNMQFLENLQNASAPPYSSAEYSKWKVVSEENHSLESLSSTSVSSETESHFLLDEKFSESHTLSNETSSELVQDDRMKTQSLMTEIKNILSKRTTSSKTMRKYAVSNEADSEKSVEHHAMPSIHSETTMESTHTGSDDAEPPSFPPHAFGSRLNIETLSPGIYGTRKYMEKYGKDINHNLKRMSSEKEIPMETTSNRNLNSDSNWDSSTSKLDSSNHSLSQHQTSSNKSDSEQTLNHSQAYREEESTVGSEDKHIIVNSKCRLQGVGQDTSSTSVSISTQGQTNLSQDQTILSSSMDGTYKKSSISITSSNKSNRKDVSKTDSSESALTDTHLLNRVLVADFGRSGLKPSQLAKRELEKLRHLVDRQKRSYIRRLQREVQRLEKFEEVFLSESLKRLSSSSHCTLNNITNTKANGSVSSRNGYNSGNGSSISVPESFLTSGNDIKDIAVPKIRTRKTSSRKGSASTNATRMMKRSSLQQVNDFGQSYPTPQPSFSETDKETTDQKISVGIQTSVLQPSSVNTKLLTKRTESRFFITLDSSPGKHKKNETARSSKYKDKAVYVRKRRPSSHTVPKYVRRNIAWFVPINAKIYIRNSARSRLQGPGCISLQEAFHLNCGHVIKHSQARLIRISKLADIRQKQTALAMEKARIASQLKVQREQELQKEEEEKRRAFTHEEMREQTEKVYKKLPEVVEKKEKKRRDQQYKTNRLMAQIYNKKLQEQVLRGKVSWAITQSCFDGDE